MIHFLQGTVQGKGEHVVRGDAYFVVEVNHVGFYVFTTHRAVLEGPEVGESVVLHTQLLVRQDAMSLVGFLNRDERDLFNLLQGASGVGAKVALAMLSALTVQDIVQAIVTENYGVLTAAKGVGKRVAQKIAVDLKEKMTQWQTAAAPGVVLPANPTLQTEAFREAEAVLLSLGYTREEVARSLDSVSHSEAMVLSGGSQSAEAAPTSEQILQASLRWLANHV